MKSDVAERFIRTSKNTNIQMQIQIYKHMTANS